MAFSVRLPELGESVTEGTVTRRLRSEDGSAAVAAPVRELFTDKVDTEVPSRVAGVVARIVAKEDETVEVGAELAVIDDGSGDSGGDAGGEQQDAAAAQEAPAQQEQPAPQEQQAEQPAPEPAQAQAEPAQQEQAQPSGGSGGGSGTPVTLPELGESVTEGTVTRWLKQVGDTVEVDEPLLEISTDKVDTEVPSPVAGTVLEITVGEDETVEVGSQLAVIGTPSEGGAAQAAPQQAAPAQQEAPAQQAPAQQEAPAQEATAKQPPAQQAAPAQQEAPAQQAPAQPQQPAPQPAAQAPAQAAEPSTDGDKKRPYVTPLVRKLAAEHGVDLSTIKGSGVGGRIRKQDVLAAAEAQSAKQAPAQEQAAPAAAAQAPAAQAPAARTQPALDAAEQSGLRGTPQNANRIRLTIAKRTKESLQTSAQLTQVHEVAVTKIARLRQQAKKSFQEREGVKLTFLPFFAKA